jgi:hypothetical protein
VTSTAYTATDNNAVTFRYHPKPVAHNFATDKPICTSAGASIAFDVPLTIYPFFKAVVRSGSNGSVAEITNPNTYDASWNLPLARTGSGLSYTPLINVNFNLFVQYVSIEKSSIYSVEQFMPVQQQGFPSNSFSITKCRWDYPNQKIQYALDISATGATADRMDAWNMYTKLSSASDSAWELQYSNILRTAGSTQPQYDVSLNQIYADYNNVDVKFVATRSLYLNQADTSNQVETIGAGVLDTKQALVTKLPAVLPRINTSDITLENTVYNVAPNTAHNTSATLKANRPSNANGLRITDSNTSVVDISGNVFDISYNITLTDSVVERSYEIRARYYSVDTPAPTFQYVDSLPVTVIFKNGTSNRPRPVIKSKKYSDSKFTVTYDSVNAGSWLNSNTALVSNVYVRKTGSTGDDRQVGRPTKVWTMTRTSSSVGNFNLKVANSNDIALQIDFRANMAVVAYYTNGIWPVVSAVNQAFFNLPLPNVFTVAFDTNNFTITYGPSNSVIVFPNYLNIASLDGISDTVTFNSNVIGSATVQSIVNVISAFNGDNVDLYVKDEFTTTYKVNGTDRSSLVQTVNSQSSLPFYLAANPQIDENSIVVDGTNKVMTVNVKNMGTPVLNNAMLVVSQDATIDEGDKGYYNLAYFNNQTNGFQSNVLESNTLDLSGNTLDISGNPLSMTTMSITENNLTGMDKVTTLTFSPINLANANPVNLVLLVRNIIEGSDSCAVANKAISYPS